MYWIDQIGLIIIAEENILNMDFNGDLYLVEQGDKHKLNLIQSKKLNLT